MTLVRGHFGVIRTRRKPLRETPPQRVSDLEISQPEPLAKKAQHRSSSLPKLERREETLPREPRLAELTGAAVLEARWELRSCVGYAPCARTGATLTQLNHRLYLFAGECRGRFNDTKVLNPDNWKWEDARAAAGSDPAPDPRAGHSAVGFRNSLVVFGGAGQFNSMLKIRTCFNRVHLYDTVSSVWKTAETSGHAPCVRRSHACALVGNTMLVYGGMDELGNVLDDLHALNLDTLKWSTPRMHKTSGLKPGKRHSACFVSAFQPSVLRQFSFDMFHLPPSYDDAFPRSSAGFYLFGGANSHGEATNDLFVLRPKAIELKDDDYYLKWSQPEVGGRPPEARYAHCGTLRWKFLVFFGGRNNATSEVSVGSLAVLNLEAMRWETVVVSGLQPAGRWGATCAVSSSQVIIFGGMRLEEFYSGLLILDLSGPPERRMTIRRTVRMLSSHCND